MIRNARLDVEREAALRRYEFTIVFEDEQEAEFGIQVVLSDRQIKGLTEEHQHLDAVVARLVPCKDVTP